MSQLQRFRQESKPSAARIMGVRPQRRSLTEQHSIDSNSQCWSSNRDNILLSKMEKSHNFPSIFIRHKRVQYGGYKQSNLSKLKTVKLHQDAREAAKYQTPRTYGINSKNIEKLRKRYSLQPNQMNIIQKEFPSMFMATSKSLQKDGERKRNDSQTERQYHKELREMLRLMNFKKQTSSGKSIPNQARTTDSLDQTPQNLSHINSQSLDEKPDELSAVGERIPQTPQKTMVFNKPYYAQIKKRVQNKMIAANKKKILPSISKLIHKDQEQVLCGWTAKSFYPKNRSQFFESSSPEKMKLIEGQI